MFLFNSFRAGLLCTAAITSVLSLPVLAEDEGVLSVDKGNRCLYHQFLYDEVAEGCDANLQTRAVVFNRSAAAGTAAATAVDVLPENLVRLSAAPIQFELGSAELLSAAKDELDTLAGVLTGASEPLPLVIEGHTDGVGAADYNLALSERRAESVLSYLADEWGVDVSQFQVVGRGEENLLSPANERAPENRRVEIVKIKK